jgi:hypothetical protein
MLLKGMTGKMDDADERKDMVVENTVEKVQGELTIGQKVYPLPPSRVISL